MAGILTHLYTLVEETNICLDKLNTWFLANKLTLNVDKTCYIVFAPFKNIVLSDHNFQLSINNVILQQLRTCKYLGVMFDDELSWKPHIDFVLKKIIKFTSIFYKLRSILPNDCIKQIYYALVYPHLLYGVEIYANTFDNHIDPLLKLNNKILRIGSVHILYNADGVGEWVKVLLYCVIYGGGGFDFCYITLFKFSTYFIFY